MNHSWASLSSWASRNLGSRSAEIYKPEYQHRYKAKNRERIRARDRAYRQRNLEGARAKQREGYWRNPQRFRSYQRAYGQRAPAKRKAWRQAHRDLISQYAVNRRARLRGSVRGRHTRAEWEMRLAAYGRSCCYCGRDDVPLVRDHIVPVSKGGTDDISNIQPACRSCNARKSARDIDEFLAEINAT